MKKSMYKLLAALAIFLCAGQGLYASHGQGADMSYIFVRYDALTGRSTYFVSFTFYRDCSGAQSPSAQTLDINNYSSGGSWDTTVSLPLRLYYPCPFRGGVIDSAGANVSDLCTAAQLQGTCSAAGGLYPGVQKYVYADTVTLPGFGTPGYNSPNWALGIAISHRNYSTNINSTGATPLYFEATINNSIDPTTGEPYHINSPIFSVDPVPFECINAPVMYNGSGISPDGDSLAYELVSPLQGHALPISFIPGYATSSPIMTGGQFSFDTRTGQMNYTPIQREIDVLAIRISAYRHGALVSTVMRDVQVNLIECESEPAVIGTPAVAQGGFLSDAGTVTTYTNSHLVLNIPASVSSGSDITLGGTVQTYAELYPGMSFAQTGTGSAPTAHIEWNVGTQTGCRYIYVSATTSGCPVSGITYAPLRLCVTDAPAPAGMTETGAKAFSAYLYPNPYTDNTVLHVVTHQEGSFTVRISDLLGQVLLDQHIRSSSPFDVPMSGLRDASGVLQIEISDADGRVALKLIKL